MHPGLVKELSKIRGECDTCKKQLEEYSNCTQEVKELSKIRGECDTCKKQLEEYSNCTQEVKELSKIRGECDTCKKQREELENCRKDLYDLLEMKGRYLAFKEQIGNTSLATVLNAQFLMQEMQDYKTQAAANADRRDLCDKHLRHVQDKMNQLIHNISVVVTENEKCKMSWKMCVDELEDIKTAIPSSHKG